ncbi:MAG TPA: DUF2809 domain-containing protein [Rhodoblastus sp.]|nr:DUF2809 domain-containing protein [Rhodoblastus sp.]
MVKRRLLLCVCVIAIGLCLRLIGPRFGVPLLLVKYGGSVLWGAMVYLLVALAARRRPRFEIVGASVAISVSVELFRLLHAPWLDAFRLTLAGALLIGRVFSLWNILAYAGGVGLAAGIDARAAGKTW